MRHHPIISKNHYKRAQMNHLKTNEQRYSSIPECFSKSIPLLKSPLKSTPNSTSAKLIEQNRRKNENRLREQLRVA